MQRRTQSDVSVVTVRSGVLANQALEEGRDSGSMGMLPKEPHAAHSLRRKQWILYKRDNKTVPAAVSHVRPSHKKDVMRTREGESQAQEGIKHGISGR